MIFSMFFLRPPVADHFPSRCPSQFVYVECWIWLNMKGACSRAGDIFLYIYIYVYIYFPFWHRTKTVSILKPTVLSNWRQTMLLSLPDFRRLTQVKIGWFRGCVLTVLMFAWICLKIGHPKIPWSMICSIMFPRLGWPFWAILWYTPFSDTTQVS